ncbi:UDP-galactose transporter [Colletotrichum chrysophilum]|uniref:UDP-galactose transporter n=1 Tax=Colletotrichum chrysophilum TaxID=1836956 RepID=A0AAD9EIE3_9PEZI|nr:UDP-galactose transporter [Colletotrichum chrysophilum]
MSFVVLSQLKLILTPIFSVVVLRQSLTMLQWLCLFTIAAGVVLVQTTSSSSATFDLKYVQDTRLGAVSMLISGTCVALAGILMESILKGSTKFIVRNAQLAAYACLCAGLSLLTRFATTITSPVGNENASFFKGYHVLVWAFVFLQAAGGFIVAWSVRVSSTVAKNYAQAVGFMIACIGPSFLSPHTVSLRVSKFCRLYCWASNTINVQILTGVGFVAAGVLGSLSDYRRPTNALPGVDISKDVEKATSPIRK